MGPKITVDSATLANKGLELIEAHFLFGLPYERIEVVVHPQSIVHALVRFRDGASLAHLGYPDMRVPISYALTYPERAATPIPRPRPRLGARRSSSRSPTSSVFPLLRLAREAGERGGTYPCAYNAANEVAVAAFRSGRLGFLEIAGARGGGARARSTGRRRATSTSCVEADAEARRIVRGSARTGMNITIAIFGLALLILVHEAGHFFTARAVGMSPRRFYIGFPPALVKVRRKGIEYGIGAIPLGGYVKIPGMHRPRRRDLDVHLGRARDEAPGLAGADRADQAARRGGRDGRGAGRSCRSSSARSRAPSCPRRRRRLQSAG